MKCIYETSNVYVFTTTTAIHADKRGHYQPSNPLHSWCRSPTNLASSKVQHEKLNYWHNGTKTEEFSMIF